MNKNYNNARTIGFITFAVVLEKILGFLKQIVFAAYFGSSNSTDAYYLAQNIVSIINSCYNTALPVAFLSIAVAENQKKKTGRDYFNSNAINTGVGIAVILTGIICLLNTIFRIPISNRYSELPTYIYALSIIVILYSASGLMGASLESYGEFVPSKLAALFISLSSIICVIVWGHKYGVIVTIFATIFGLLLHIIFERFLIKKYYTYHPFYLSKDKRINNIFLLSVPIMISTALSSINSLIDKIIAGGLGEGSVSALNYSHLISIELVVAIVITAISSIVVVNFSKCISLKRYDELRDDAEKTLRIMYFITFSILPIFLCFSKEIITIVYKRGSFDERSVIMTSIAFIGYSIGLIFSPLQEISLRVFYSYQDSKTPLINSFISMVINALLSYLLAIRLGIFGISFSTSIALGINAFLNIIILKRRYNLTLRTKSMQLGKSICSCIITMVIAFVIRTFFIIDNAYVLIGFSFFVCFITYILTSYLFRNSAINDLKKLFQERRGE